MTTFDEIKLETATTVEIFIETDEKLGGNGKRRHSRHWERAQQACIVSLALSEQISSILRWAASLFNKTWLTSWDMWEQQNRILHRPVHP